MLLTHCLLNVYTSSITPGEYALLFFVILASGLSFLLFKKINREYLKLALSFTGAFLFALCMMEMIPEVFKSATAGIGLYILIGFFSQILIEFFSEGIEHGHIHVHKDHDHAFPLTMMIGLCIHSFLEAMPLPRFDDPAHSNSHSLLYAIVLHHIPIAFALMSMLKASHIKNTTAIICLVIFAAMPPVGALASQVLSDTALINVADYYDKIMAVVIGIFLHVSTTILFESDHDHRFNLKKLIIVILGASLAFLHL
ncbi:MAG: ZIP family metal transporter [Bacteroidia bacterium]